MYRKMLLVVVLLFATILLVSCADKEKENLIKDKANLQSRLDQKDTTINQLSKEGRIIYGKLDQAEHEVWTTRNSLAACQKQVASLKAERKQLQSQLTAAQTEVTRLAPFEGMYAECAKELVATKADFTNAKEEIVQLSGRVVADSARTDSILVCYDVQRHNAEKRSWWQHTWGRNKWGLPFPELLILTQPRITANPAAKPQPVEKKPARRRR